MAWIPAAAAVAGSVIQGIASEDAADSAHSQASANRDMQIQFAKHGIRWRVEDAIRAGVHPLYALGGSGAAFAPSPVVMEDTSHWGQMGQNVGTALQRHAESAAATELRDAQLATARAQAAKDLAHAALFDAERMRILQTKQETVPFPTVPVQVPDSELGAGASIPAAVSQVTHDAVKWKPQEITTPRGVDPAVTAGPSQPGLSEYQLKDGFKVVLPAGSSLSEALEALSESSVLLDLFVGQNIQHYGPGWIRQAAESLPVYGLPVRAFYRYKEAIEDITRYHEKDEWKERIKQLGGHVWDAYTHVPRRVGRALFGRPHRPDATLGR